ncbi:MAG: hypothetical protein KKB32_02455, partial [Acidobacteria bacterium]|nr:hypothetical protein [Acidobacteriota bacterium]
MTCFGGNNFGGTIFKIQNDGTGFALLHGFAGGFFDGRTPYGSLILSGSTLYGMTNSGGDGGKGTIFKLQTNGSSFALLHPFAGGSDDGAWPEGSLIIDGTSLYGLSKNGGDSDMGVIFSLPLSTVNNITITSPNGGENWTIGSEHDITWTSTGSITNVNIYYSTNNGASWSTEVFGTANDGNYTWTVPAFTFPPTSSTTCLVRISNATNGVPVDTSDDIFAMSVYVAPTITVTSPNGGESWMVSDSHDITWTSTGTIANVKIEYSINNGSSWSNIVTFTANDGSYSWTIPDTPSTTCLVRISDAADNDSSDSSDAVFTILAYVAPTITVTAPNGGETWTAVSSHNITWSSTGIIASVNIDYSTNNGSSWSPVAAGTANDGIYSWTVPSTPSTTCLVRVRDAVDSDPSDSSDAVFTIAVPAETVSAPSTPSGPTTGINNTSYAFSTDGSTSNLGHSIQYKFDWDDGSDSGWLAAGTTQASHSWSANGTYDVRAMARCVTHTDIESLWSETHAIIISDTGTLYYNSPSQQKVLPEVIWSAATGGGTWMSEVQVTDVSGSSQVSVYYNAASGRRGPFLLWDNSAGGALSSVKYTNLLETIDGLDSETFTYYGTVGAVEFITQDGNHTVQAAARTLNGSYAKTFTALSLHDANTATTSRAMIVANLSNNVSYR